MTWTQRMAVISPFPPGSWFPQPTVACDSTGKHLVLAAGDIWTSTDGGGTWTDRTAGTSLAGKQWLDIASDASGTRLVVIAESDIWTSSNAGETWTNRTVGTAAAGRSWQSVASDSAGSHLIAVSDGIWISTDSGATWTNRTPATPVSFLWFAVASNAAGTHFVAAVRPGDIWTSADSGISWTNETAGTPASRQSWQAVASDATGRRLVAVTIVARGFADLSFSFAAGIWTN